MEGECINMQEDAPEVFGDSCLGRLFAQFSSHHCNCSDRFQKCIWDLIEHPESSQAANIVSYISMMFVVVSTIGMSLNTLPGLKVLDEDKELQNNPLLEEIEAVCIAWFTLEYFLRYCFSY